MPNHIWMTAGLVAGLLLGFGAAATGDAFLLGLANAVRPLGRLFLNLLSMVVIPLVATALFTGVAGLGHPRQLGRVGVRALAFYWSSTVIAILIGFGVAWLLLPLASLSPEQQAALRQSTESAAAPGTADAVRSGARFVIDLIPANPLRAAVDASLLPLIVFVTITGVAAASLADEKRHALVELADGATQALIRVVGWVLWLAPVGIFALVAPVVAQLGLAVLKSMALFLVAVILGLLVFITAVYLPAAALLGRVSPRRMLRAGFPSLAMGFSSTSSLAALPALLDAARGELDLPRSVSGFVLPFGASLNRGGSALYQAVALLFVAQLYGVTLDAGQAIQAGAAVFLASLTVAAVPSASVVSLAPAFTQTGLPLAGLSLLIGLDRIPDMFRTMTNVAGHLTGAIVVSAMEKGDESTHGDQ